MLLCLQALENSLSQDYVSEKVYDGLIAGCVPIYWGAANIDDFIPHKSAIINYAELGSTEALQEELERLANNQTAYEEKLAWKKWPSTRWNPGEFYADAECVVLTQQIDRCGSRRCSACSVRLGTALPLPIGHRTI
mgnify:CR=1 FL=1